jgi:hypothetical protein
MNMTKDYAQRKIRQYGISKNIKRLSLEGRGGNMSMPVYMDCE